MVGELPRKLSVKGNDYQIRTDYRDILKILIAFNDPNLADEEKVFICLFILYKDFDIIPVERQNNLGKGRFKELIIKNY